MRKSLIKIVSGKQNISGGTLTLIIDLIAGIPAKGDLIFLREQFYGVHAYPIKKVKKQFFGGKHEIVVEFPEMEWMWKDRIEQHIVTEDDTVFCGIGIEEYHSKNIDDRLAYQLSVVEIIGSDRVQQFIKRHSKFSLVLLPNEEDSSGGLSKLGGAPIAPEGYCYPKASNGQSALFLGQLHIKELNEWFSTSKEFSEEGVLYFYATVVKEDDYCSYGDIIVEYSNEVANMKELPLPDDLAEFGILREQDIQIAEEINIPPQETSLWEGEEMTDEERNMYHQLEGILEQYNVFYGSNILGYPHQIQGCVLLETEFKQTKRGWYSSDFNSDDQNEIQKAITESTANSREWRTLFQMDGDAFSELSKFKGSFNEHHDGRYYVMIKQEDLDRMDFSRTVTIYQCT